MKKLFALLLAVIMVVSMATVVSAKTTTLTTTVPDATYVLNVPKDQEIPFGATSTDIGNVTITNSSGFAEGKNVEVTLTYGDFTCGDTTTTIPMSVTAFFQANINTNVSEELAISSGSKLPAFSGKTDGTVSEQVSINYSANVCPMKCLRVNIDSDDWGKALGGEYTAIITFSAEVVVEE